MDLAKDNEHQVAFWYLASTIRHIGVGNFTRVPDERKDAVRQALSCFCAHRQCFTNGEFFGVGKLIHIRSLKNREAIVLFFNDQAEPVTHDVTVLNADLGFSMPGTLQVKPYVGADVRCTSFAEAIRFECRIAPYGISAVIVTPRA